MKTLKFLTLCVLILVALNKHVNAQENPLRIYGEFFTDQRILIEQPYDWVWNENRLNLQLDKRFGGKSKFHTEIWVRNFGLPQIYSSSDLYNKGIIDPIDLQIREAYVELYGFLFKNLDVKIGRQRIAWGTGDRLNPTDNLNPYDLEDILDFGRHRGSDAINLNYYLTNSFSLQAIYIPFFRPDNLPVGVFAQALTPPMELPPHLYLNEFSDTLLVPKFNLSESSVLGFKFKGFALGFDFSLSYVWGREGLPMPKYNTFIPVNLTGGTNVNSQLYFPRNHIFGADLAGSIGSVGVWAEAAVFLPAEEVIMTNDLSAMVPEFLRPMTVDSVILKKEPYVKFIVGADYTFGNGLYLNFQYLHGFMNEKGKGELNDYFFIGMEKTFFEEKLKIVPLAGAFIVSNWKDIGNNYSLIYVPEIEYRATDNISIGLSAALFTGKGNNVFVSLNDYNMLMFKLKYNF